MNPYRQQMQWTIGGRMTPMVKILMIVSAVVFLCQLIFEKFFGFDPSLIFGLVPADVTSKFYVWQLFTYMFLHGHLMHLLFNMLVLWMLGGEIEEKVFWAKGFLKYYLICGLGAGVFNVVFSFNSIVPIIGSSGSMYGILMAYAVFFGNRQLILFPFPVLIRAKVLVLIIFGIEFISSIFYTTDGVAHLAHMGGMIVGYLYIRYRLNGPPKLFKRKPKFTVIKGGGNGVGHA